MRVLVVVVVAAALLCLSAVAAGGSRRVLSAHGVRLAVPAGWQRVRPAGAGAVTDPRTVIVAGTRGVVAAPSSCQIAAYAIPPRGAVVVVVGWRTPTSGGGHPKPGRAPLRDLRTVRRPSFECFRGRGAAAQVMLGGRVYQVNVMVGDEASRARVAEALAVARSFDLDK